MAVVSSVCVSVSEAVALCVQYLLVLENEYRPVLL